MSKTCLHHIESMLSTRIQKRDAMEERCLRTENETISYSWPPVHSPFNKVASKSNYPGIRDTSRIYFVQKIATQNVHNKLNKPYERANVAKCEITLTS